MKVIVVGAGASGLTAAEILSRGRHQVTVVDRIPASGGVLGYDHQIIRDLHSTCAAAGVSFALGTTALRWEGHSVLLAGPQGIQWAPADHLVYAGGIRPGTPAEVGLVGSRLAGVLTATVAVHLAEAGVVIGRRVAIIGGGYWADRACTELGHSCSEIIQVVPCHESAVSDGPVAYSGWRATEVRGAGRVSELIIAKAGAFHRVMCDAVILAGGIKPLRNVDGAVGEADGVTFIQRTEANDSLGAVTDYARRAAREVSRDLSITASNHEIQEAEL